MNRDIITPSEFRKVKEEAFNRGAKSATLIIAVIMVAYMTAYALL